MRIYWLKLDEPSEWKVVLDGTLAGALEQLSKEDAQRYSRSFFKGVVVSPGSTIEDDLFEIDWKHEQGYRKDKSLVLAKSHPEASKFFISEIEVCKRVLRVKCLGKANEYKG